MASIDLLRISEIPQRNDWFLLELPTATTASFVRDLAVLVPEPMRHKLDGWRIEISSHFRNSEREFQPRR